MKAQKKDSTKPQQSPEKKAREAAHAANVNLVTRALRAWDNAAKGEAGAYLAVFLIVASTGERVTSEMLEKAAPHVAPDSRSATASKFNRAAVVAGILGRDKTEALIREAAERPGKKHENISTALGAVMEANREAGNKPSSPATGAQVIDFAARAAQALDAKQAAREANKAAATERLQAAREANKSGGTATLTPAATTDAKALLAALQLFTRDVARLVVPEERKGAQGACVKRLQDAQEELAKLAK